MLTVHPKYRFGGFDEVVIEGVSYRPFEANTCGIQFVRTDGSELVEFFSDADIAVHVARGRLIHRRDEFRPKAPGRVAASELEKRLRGLNKSENARLAVRHAMTRAFKEAYADGAVRRTHSSVEAAKGDLRLRAEEILRKEAADRKESKEVIGEKLRKLLTVSSSTLLRWLRVLDTLGLPGLTDNWSRSGRRESRLTVDEAALLQRCAEEFMSVLKPSKSDIYRRMCNTFDEVNLTRKNEGKIPLRKPSREALRKSIARLDPFVVDLHRIGKKQAVMKHRPIGEGVRPSRLLERVEIDEWPMDLITLMKAHGLDDYLTDEQKAVLGLDGEKDRWQASVAICATTRCIVGFVLMRQPSAAAAIQTLQMMINPKTQISEELQTRSPWSMHGLPETIVTDNGSAYTSHHFQRVTETLDITVHHTPPDQPHLRGTIERFFKTMSSKLMVELRGRTFSNPQERGDYNSEKNAVLDASDLAEIVVRWLVDVYHNTPHAGLDGRTPIEAWEMLAEEGVAPPPDAARQRAAFGVPMTRKVTQHGVTVLGMAYRSKELMTWRMRAPGDHVVRIQWSPHDIGAIDVEIGGEWIEVEAVNEDVRHGVNARMWSAVGKSIRRRMQRGEAANAETIRAALDRIRAIDSAAAVRVGLIADEWSASRVEQAEAEAFLGFRHDRAETGGAPAAGPWGVEVLTDAPSEADAEELPPSISASGPMDAPSVDERRAAPVRGDGENSAGWSVME